MTESSPKPKVGTKGIHHLAFATRDSKATYDFYHNKLGMKLARTENHRQGDGYFKHYFFDMGDEQYLGFFEVHNVGESKDFKTDLSESVGLPLWVNHVAFKVESKEMFDELKTRAKDNGVPILAEVDHDWCFSLYMHDPNGLMVEYTYDLEPEKFVQDPDEAYRLLFEVAGEDIGEDSRKTKVSTDV